MSEEITTNSAEFDKAVDDIIEELEVSSEEDKKDEPELVGLAAFIKDCFERSDSSRQAIEDNWLDDLRQYKGAYSEEILRKMHPHRSKAFVRMTRTKVKTVDSRLSDLLFPANGDRNWDITPTPIPEFSAKKMEALLSMWREESGQDVTSEEFQLLLQDEANKQARKMAKTIEDQLSESRYREIMRNVIHSGNLYGTGILKGPLVAIAENHQYYKSVNKNGKEKWLLEEKDSITPFIEYVRIWDVYPDMESDDISSCRYVIQRRKMDKHELVALAKRSDFSQSTIMDYLDENPNGDYKKKSFETTLSTLGDIVDSGISAESTSKKYEVLEFWGYVDAQDLMEAGVEVPEDKKSLLELSANVWMLGDHIIKASLSPVEGIKWPYFFYYYDKDETSIFGEGIPSIMRDVQELINSAFRAMLDNAAISAGPQVEVNMDLMSEDEDLRDFYPFKVWVRTGVGQDASAPAIRMLDFPSYTGEFERMIEMFRNYGDEVTSIPRYMWGEASGSAARTASGLSMLMGSANVTIKDQVKNFDDGITKPFITAMYYWNMQFSTDEDIKGDYSVIAQGTSSLMAKEVRSQSLISFAQMTAAPADASIVKRPQLIRAIAESLDLDEDNLVMSDKEIEVQQQQQQQQQEQERQWMSEMVEVARSEGISPTALLDSLRLLRREIEEPVNEQQPA